MVKIVDFQKDIPRRQFYGKRLEIARTYRGIGATELAENTGVNRQTISMYENNKLTNPEFSILQRISTELHFPVKFFLESCPLDIEDSPTYFRSLLTAGKRYHKEQEAKILLIKIIYEYLSKYLTFKQLNLPAIDKNEGVEAAALSLRDCWGLGRRPIDNLAYIAESNGLIVLDLAPSTEGADAFSHRVHTNGKETFLIGYSGNKRAASGIHFDIAHELGHILLHGWNTGIDDIKKEDFKKLEQEANDFASAFLLPKDEFTTDIGKYANNLAYYVEMKKRWKVSISTMIGRSYSLGLIGSDEYRRLIRYMQKQGIKKTEPLDDKLVTARPSLLREAIHILLGRNVVTPNGFLDELSSDYGLTIYPDEIENLLGLEKGTFDVKISLPKISLELKKGS